MGVMSLKNCMKSKITKMLFLILASAPISIRAELPDSFNSPSRNPCSHSDSTCLDYYANTGRSETETKKIKIEVRAMTAEEIKAFSENSAEEIGLLQ